VKLIVDPATKLLDGTIHIPGDKSIGHRALLFSLLSATPVRVLGLGDGADNGRSAKAITALGAKVTKDAPAIVIAGTGLDAMTAPASPIDCGNSGTTIRLLCGLLAGQRFPTTLIGDESLSKRPMRRVIAPLAAMGARIESEPGGLPPLRILGGARLHGVETSTPVASAQVKSALLLAGLYAEGETMVREPHPTRDYTERMLAAFGYPIEFAPGLARLRGGHRLTAIDVDVPADFSSAAFFIVAATLAPGSELRIEAVGMNPRRTGLLQALRAMGADIREENRNEQGGEPVADLVVRHAPLHGIDVPVEIVPDMIDEFPALFVAAACAKGRTIVRGAAELRVKESDRIATMAAGLRALGIDIEETPDGAVIEGGRLAGGVVESHGDHRIAMSFAVAAQLANGNVRINDVANVATSFPGFVELARDAGMNLGD